jgi:hypothetical protein
MYVYCAIQWRGRERRRSMCGLHVACVEKSITNYVMEKKMILMKKEKVI